jgi:hypothetical protein
VLQKQFISNSEGEVEAKTVFSSNKCCCTPNMSLVNGFRACATLLILIWQQLLNKFVPIRAERKNPRTSLVRNAGTLNYEKCAK